MISVLKQPTLVLYSLELFIKHKQPFLTKYGKKLRFGFFKQFPKNLCEELFLQINISVFYGFANRKMLLCL